MTSILTLLLQIQGVSYTVSSLTLPSLLSLPSASSASHALTNLVSYLRLPVSALSALSAAPLLLSFALSPRASRHPYLVYTSLLAILSATVPKFLSQPAAAAPRSRKQQQQANLRAANLVASRNMEASYEVLGEVQSEVPSDEDLADEFNGEEVRAEIEGVAKSFVVRTGLAALGFAMAVVGIWGDGAPQAVVVVA